MKGKTENNLMCLFTLCQLNNVLTELCIVEMRYDGQGPWFVSYSDCKTGSNEAVINPDGFCDSDERRCGGREIRSGLKEDPVVAGERFLSGCFASVKAIVVVIIVVKTVVKESQGGGGGGM